MDDPLSLANYYYLALNPRQELGYNYVWCGSNTGNLPMLKEGVKQQGKAALHILRMGVSPLYATITHKYFDCMVFILQHVNVMLPVTEDHEIPLRVAMRWKSIKCTEYILSLMTCEQIKAVVQQWEREMHYRLNRLNAIETLDTRKQIKRHCRNRLKVSRVLERAQFDRFINPDTFGKIMEFVGQMN